MKNKFEGSCYVCGELVEEERGVAEKILHLPTAGGFGDSEGRVWGVRHKECKRLTDEERKEQIKQILNDQNHGNN